jgi:hypothetical protein
LAVQGGQSVIGVVETSVVEVKEGSVKLKPPPS